MKTIITIIFLMCVASVYSQSNITYDAGTNIDVGTGADVCADVINVNGSYSGGGTFCNGALPVTLISFESRITKNDVKLIWVTENEINNSGFDIERKKGEGNWEKISFVQGNGTTNEPKIYTYDDKKLQSATYKFRLKQIDYNGNYEYFNLNNDVVIDKPNVFSMSQNYPNPSNPKSKIDYEIPFNGKVSLKIYNLLGQEVVSLINEVKEAGYYTAEFDGSNLASGVYFYRIIAEGEGKSFNKTLKLVLVK